MTQDRTHTQTEHELVVPELATSWHLKIPHMTFMQNQKRGLDIGRVHSDPIPPLLGQSLIIYKFFLPTPNLSIG